MLNRPSGSLTTWVGLRRMTGSNLFFKLSYQIWKRNGKDHAKIEWKFTLIWYRLAAAKPVLILWGIVSDNYFVWCYLNLESGEDNLLGLERIIRLSISSPDAVFKEEGHKERLLRLSVYSQTLVLLIIQKTQKWLSSDNIERELLQLRGYLGRSYNKAKDLFHYSMEFINQAIGYLAKNWKKFENSRVMAYLKECTEKSDPRYEGNRELTFIKTLKNPRKAKKRWFALHCVILYLHFKVGQMLKRLCHCW